MRPAASKVIEGQGDEGLGRRVLEGVLEGAANLLYSTVGGRGTG